MPTGEPYYRFGAGDEQWRILGDVVHWKGPVRGES